MKIAIYTHSVAPSIDGVCRRFTGIVTEMVCQGHEILLFTLEDKPEDLPSERVTFVTIDHMFFPSYPSKKVARPTLRSFMRIYSALQTFQPEILHVVADAFSHIFQLASKLLSLTSSVTCVPCPCVGSFHTDLVDLIQSLNGFFFQKWLVLYKEYSDGLLFDSCATTSESFRRKLKHHWVHCEHIIVTSVDPHIFNPDRRSAYLRDAFTFKTVNNIKNGSIEYGSATTDFWVSYQQHIEKNKNSLKLINSTSSDDEAFVMCYAGRISNEKNIGVLVEALHLLRAKPSLTSKVSLVIIGDGPHAPVYSQLHSADTRIFCQPAFLAHEQLGQVYASCDVHVSASEFETLGNTVLEAFSSSIPCIVPQVQGFMDTVTPSIDGFLFQPGNAADLAEKLEYLITHPETRIAMGQAGRIAMKSRVISEVVKDLLRWYECGSKNKKRLWNVTLYIQVAFLLVDLLIVVFAFNLYDWICNALLKDLIPYLTATTATKMKTPRKKID